MYLQTAANEEGQIPEEPAYIGAEFTCEVVGYTADEILMECPNYVNFVPQNSMHIDLALGLALMGLIAGIVICYIVISLRDNPVVLERDQID